MKKSRNQQGLLLTDLSSVPHVTPSEIDTSIEIVTIRVVATSTISTLVPRHGKISNDKNSPSDLIGGIDLVASGTWLASRINVY